MAGVETAEDFGAPPVGTATRWKAEIVAFEKERHDWHERVGVIEARYRDERKRGDEGRRFALLWSNIEVLSPTLYAQVPKAAVSRRFKDRDPVARVAATILERNLDVAIEEGGTFDRTMRSAVRGFLLGGQGTAWVRYDVAFDVQPAAPTDGDQVAAAAEGQGDQPADAAPAGPVATMEAVRFEWVHRKDFGFTAGARVWDEVTVVWRRSFLTRDALVKRFGAEKGKAVPLDCKRPGDDDTDTTFAKATVYEGWDSATRRVWWCHVGMDELLDERPYPLKISGRFPCPTPLFGTLMDGSMTPVPDYVQYQDQANELDVLTARITALTEALRVAGMTPGDTAPDVQKALNTPGEATVVPVPSWAAFGGQKLSELIAWLPIQEIAATLDKLVAMRQRVKDDAYEITGLSDVLRGATQASETATAQRLKAQWGGIRVRTRQGAVQGFAAEALGLMADVLLGHFSADRLADRAAVAQMSPADQQMVPQAMALLTGDQALRHWRVDVETDSTVETDQDADKAAWTEMLTAVATFLQGGLPLLEGIAKSAPAAAGPFASMMGEMLTGGVRRFKAGDNVETAIEMAFEALGQAAAQPPPAPGQAPPDPVEAAKQQVAGAKVQVEGQKVQVAGAQVQAERERTAADAAAQQDESAHRHADRQLEAARLVHEASRPASVPAQGVVG